MPSVPIRLFIVDDHILFRESLTVILSVQKDFQVVGQGSSVAEAKPHLSAGKSDILLLEMGLPGHSSLELLREISSLSPNLKTIAISEAEAQEDVVEAMRLGARGFLRKQCPVDLFFKCIRKVHEGEIWLSGTLTDAVIHAFGNQAPSGNLAGKNELSRRESEVIQLVIQGYKNRDIGQKLFISEKTVKNHLSAIFNKLGVNDRLELALYAFEKRLFPTLSE